MTVAFAGCTALGPRQCGKSTLAVHLDPDRLFVSLDEGRYLETARVDPDGFIESLPEKVTIDEIQRAPGLLRAIKRSVDMNRKPGRFILTGSANLLLLPEVDESLAGRMQIVRLQPFTDSEKEGKAGAFLETLLDGNLKPSIQGGANTAQELFTRMLKGGYPEVSNRSMKRTRQWHRDYLRSIVDRDIKDVAKVKDADDVARMLEVIAIRTGELQNFSSLANELKISNATAERYLSVLQRLFLVRRLRSWQKNPAKRLVKSPKYHIVDAGLGATLMGLNENSWRDERTRVGHLLESYVLQQIIAQAGWTDPDLQFHHYRDKDKIEVDLVLNRGRDTWGIEIKAASSVSKRDGAGLKRLADICGKDFRGGVVFYAGNDTLRMGDDRLLAVPISELWTR